jgi:dihydrodipicolinate synthase/N-acetylneuraminate lyase
VARSGGSWQPGQCGNPKGRPKGARDRRSNLRCGLLKEVPAILKTLAAAAKGGDIQAAKLILERTLPALKTAAETLTRPGADTPASQGRTVLGACAQGDISPDEAATLMQAISAQARVVEVEELTQRVQALEQALQR